MILQNLLSCFCLIFMLSLSVNAAAITEEKSLDLTVLSYNIKGLPGIAGGYNNKKRMREIGRLLQERLRQGSAPDIVLIQEAFVGETKHLVNEANYPYVVYGPGKTANDESGDEITRLYGSGLILLSRHKVLGSQQVVFAKKDCGTWDCQSNKGVQLVEIQVPGLPFNLSIANTHLQSGRKYDEIRVLQMRTLKRFLAQHLNLESGFIFAGDFNSFPERKSFDYWLETTQLENVGMQCIEQKCESRKIASANSAELLYTPDQHFYQNSLNVKKSDKFQLKPTKAYRNFKEIFMDKPLSDHLGYEVTYRINW